MCDRPTDGPTDLPSYRYARTHLKTYCNILLIKDKDRLSDMDVVSYPSEKTYSAIGSFPQKNLLLSNFSICHFQLVFFHKLKKLSLFPILDNLLHSSSKPQTSQLSVKVFARHTGHSHRISMRLYFKGYWQKMRQNRFFQCIVIAPWATRWHIRVYAYTIVCLIIMSP